MATRRTRAARITALASGEPQPLAQGHEAAVAEDHVVLERNAEDLARVAQALGDPQVLRARLGIAGGMVVGDDQRGGRLANRAAEDLARMDQRGGQRARAHRNEPAQALLAVEQEAPERLLLEPARLGLEELEHRPRRAQAGAFGLALAQPGSPQREGGLDAPGGRMCEPELRDELRGFESCELAQIASEDPPAHARGIRPIEEVLQPRRGRVPLYASRSHGGKTGGWTARLPPQAGFRSPTGPRPDHPGTNSPEKGHGQGPGSRSNKRGASLPFRQRMGGGVSGSSFGVRMGDRHVPPELQAHHLAFEMGRPPQSAKPVAIARLTLSRMEQATATRSRLPFSWPRGSVPVSDPGSRSSPGMRPRARPV